MTAAEPRTGKQLLAETKRFASERRALSWWCLASTYSAMVLLFALALLPLPGPLRLLVSVLEALFIVRTFMLFHDHLHGAILKDAPLAAALLHGFGFFVMTPPKNWRQTHNYHHAHTAKIVGSHVGSYALLTTQMYQALTPGQKLAYRITRHPLTIALGMLTVFVWGMVLGPFVKDPRKHTEALVTVALHALLAAVIIHLGGVGAWLFAVVLPLAVAHAMGGYLFYAQHNFPGMHIEPRQTWEYTKAALQSSSYMRTGRVMQWFTGNIGYHHVHHLNPSIPFYRLPEAMAALPELQHPGTTSLAPADIVACFKLKLWDGEANEMVGYPRG